MAFLVHTDFGHDPDDAIALAYLIEHEYIPSIIGLTPGHLQQNMALSGFLNGYRLWHLPIQYYCSELVMWNNTFYTGKHKIFEDEIRLLLLCLSVFEINGGKFQIINVSL